MGSIHEKIGRKSRDTAPVIKTLETKEVNLKMILLIARGNIGR